MEIGCTKSSLGLTEKSGELSFEFNGVVQVAKWNDLKTLYNLECNCEFKLSKINAVAFFPKPIERQRVDTALRVFCDQTVSALETHPFLDTKSVEGTANFIKIILKFWKIVNVKGEGADTRFRDDSRGVIRSSNDPRLLFLLDLADMADKMKNTGGKRIRQLSKDTAESLSHLCHGFVELAKYLLDCGNAYVIFGWFTTDPLEQCFSKLRQGSGGTHFITAQSVMEKVRIQHAKLTLQLGIEVSGENGHSCGNCSRNLDEKESEIMDNLSALEENIQEDTLLSIIYIAGYIQIWL